MIKKTFIIVLTVLFALTACSSKKKRPIMAKDQRDKATTQDIKIFSEKNSGKSFNKTSKKFARDAKNLLTNSSDLNKRQRRFPLHENKILSEQVASENQYAKTVDMNQHVKNLETIPVTLEFNSINIRSALRLMAQMVKRNLIIGDEVTGDVTLDFQDIRWGSAAYAILDMNDLVMLVDNKSGMLRVHTKTKYIEIVKQKFDQRNQLIKASLNQSATSNTSDSNVEEEEEQFTEIFKIYHADSARVLAAVSPSFEGSTFRNDEDNNQIIVSATMQNLDDIEKMIDQIDLERKQVMIEAYIINAEDGFQESFDASLNTFQPSRTGILAGEDAVIVQNNNVRQIATATNPGATAITGVGPVTNGFDDATLQGGMLILGNIGRLQLQAIISAAVNDTNSENISNPKLFAMDGEQASITQGLTLQKVIPATGDQAAAIQAIPLNLTLTVTPTIRDEKVSLEINVSNNGVGATNPGTAGTDTPVNTEQVSSTISILSGDVAVLGGVYKNTRVDSENYVPILSKIPILGQFFKTTSNNDNKQQLLIFITANIV